MTALTAWTAVHKFQWHKKAPKQDTGRYLQFVHICNEFFFCYLCLSKGEESFKLIQLLFAHLEAFEIEFY